MAARIGQQVGADGPDGPDGRSSGCEDDQSCGPNRGQVVYRLMPRPVVSLLTCYYDLLRNKAGLIFGPPYMHTLRTFCCQFVCHFWYFFVCDTLSRHVIAKAIDI